MKILVTGANGFIGKHICEFLGTQSHEVFRVVRKNENNLENTFEVDLSDDSASQKLIYNLQSHKIDVVIHLASKLASVNQSENEQVQVLLDNIAITKNMVNIVKELKPKKLINFSSMAVYPNIDGVFDEQSQVRMSGNSECMYGLSKFCSENIFDFILRNQNILISNLRVAQVYGEGARQDRIMSIMKQELEEKNTITVFGNGERQSNFIHIDKLLIIVNYFVNNNVYGIYNIGDEDLSYLQLAEKIIEIYGDEYSEILKIETGSKSKFYLDSNKISKIMLV